MNRICDKRCGATPLLFLLDGVLSQDEGRIHEALQEMVVLGCFGVGIDGGGPLLPFSSSPCTSRESLLTALTALLHIYPEFAAIKSEHDDSLPIHFAASLGSVPVAELIFSKVGKYGPLLVARLVAYRAPGILDWLNTHALRFVLVFWLNRSSLIVSFPVPGRRRCAQQEG
jgi:hypothetical protein